MTSSYINYRQGEDIKALSSRLTQNLTAINTWALWVNANTSTLDSHIELMDSQMNVNQSFLDITFKLSLKINALEKKYEGFKEFDESDVEYEELTIEGRKLIGNIYDIREGQLHILQKCETDTGI